MAAAAAIEGIFVPNMVPLDAAGDVNEAELRRYVDWLIGRGAHGLFVNGTTGEFTRFTPDERRHITRTVCEQAAGRVPVVAGAGEANVREVLRAAEVYLRYGARAVAVVAPYYYKLGQDAIHEYFCEIARQSPIDVLLYNIPAFASPMSPETIRRLAELPRIVGIKDSSGDLALMAAMAQAIRPTRPGFALITGSEAVLLPMLHAGADGGTHSTAGVIPEVFRKLFDLAKQRQEEPAAALQLSVRKLLNELLKYEFPEGFRAGVQARGFAMGKGRQPMPASMVIDRPRIEALIRNLLEP